MKNLAAMHTNKWVMSSISMSRVTHIHAGCSRGGECWWHAEPSCYALQRRWMYVPRTIDTHGLLICVTLLIYMCNMTRVTCVMRLVYIFEMRNLAAICYIGHGCMCHDSWICLILLIYVSVIWLIYTCDMPHWPIWHHSFRCVSWLICVCDTVTSVREIRNLSLCSTMATNTCAMTRWYMDRTTAHVWHDLLRHDSFVIWAWGM